MVEIVPSILSADFARLAEEIARVERGGARMLHLDVVRGIQPVSVTARVWSDRVVGEPIIVT